MKQPFDRFDMKAPPVPTKWYLRPLTLALGLRGGRKWLGDALFVLSVVLLFAAAAFVIYYLRWNLW